MQAEVTHGIRTRGIGLWGGEMNTVKITIEVEVPDNATQAAVDDTGQPWSFCGNAEIFDCDSFGQIWTGKNCTQCRVINWRETLTEVK